MLKRTSRTYINAQTKYWAGDFNDPRGAKLRLTKMHLNGSRDWDFENPDASIELSGAEIETLKSYLNHEFVLDSVGDKFWVRVSDKEVAELFSGLSDDGDAHSAALKQVIKAMKLDEELLTAILESDQAKLAFHLKERERRSKTLDELQQLIEHADTKEAEFQGLLEENTWIFGGEVLDAEVLRTITPTDQVDIPIVRGDGSMVIVELKRAKKANLVRKDHDYPILGSDVHTAVQQAQRYLYELDRSADILLNRFRFDGRRATALVVIGVRPDLEGLEAEKFTESFRIYNSHLSRVQVITYDDLLQNARRLLEWESPRD